MSSLTDGDAELIFHAIFINLIIVKLTSIETLRIAFLLNLLAILLLSYSLKIFTCDLKISQDNKINSNIFYLMLFIYKKKLYFFKAFFFFCFFKLSFKKNEHDYSQSC